MIRAAVIEYGSSNSGSVLAALRRAGVRAALVREPSDIVAADLLVLPGVGHAGLAMRHLSEAPIRTELERRHAAGGPILGICLGAQLMFEHLDEAGGAGLGWMAGSVHAIEVHPGHHTGWSRLAPGGLAQHGLGRGIHASDTFYFNHGFAIRPGGDVGAVVTDGFSVTAVVVQEHLVGVQFHPEKSQGPGARFLRNLVEDRYGL